jgi:molecular chaperone DnaK (HSP70)
MALSKFIIGIDLGTTNCTLAYASQEEGDDVQIEQFDISQLTAAGTQTDDLSLPSFIYFPLSEEIKAKQAAISWDSANNFCIGTYARNRGAELPSRLIASSKSWLCHNGIDRREAVLPFGSGEVIDKISPLDACSMLLSHLREAWDSKMSEKFVEQQILITVPASFDPAARQLVQEATVKAGYPEVILLEEPQAAFYAWLNMHAHDWRNVLKVDDCVLVIDIGGGTTDFSLIAVNDQNGDLALRRIAVGSHLLLGGDNIDLSLAYHAKTKLEEQGHPIDDWQLQSLIHSCRRAKEVLLGESPPKHVDITVMGRGSRLVGASLKTKLTLADVRTNIIEGFTPLVSPQERSVSEKRSGLQQVGLPYAQDARLTSQMAKFLSMTGESESSAMDNFVMPTAVLFNGGTTKAIALRERLVEQLNQWAKSLGKPPVKVLSDADYDFAVSRGAVNYGRARSGKSIRIRSGTSRSFFIGVEEARLAVPGVPPQLKAICIAPFGLEEGSTLQLDNQEFALVVGELATFRFFSHATPTLHSGVTPAMGTVVKQWKEELTELHPIEARLDSAEGDGKTIRVKIQTCVTELGVLELWCIANDGRQWKLEFDIRKEDAFCCI